MSLRLAHLSLFVLLALGVATGAHAQSRTPAKRSAQAVLPVWSDGKLEAVLLLEPTDDAAGARWRSGGTSLDVLFGLESGDSLGVLCDRKTGLASALGNLANNCLLASFDEPGSRRTSGTAALARGGSRLGLTAGHARDTLPAWLRGNGQGAANSDVDVNDLTVFAERNVGRQGVVSIAGTMAKATLMTPAEADTLGFADGWTTRSVTVGGGYGNFGASIVGHVVDTPGQPKWEGLGLGLTWRTPWSGQLTVGAENIVTRGRNPFSPTTEGADDEGTIPYVRYEQDL